MIPFAARPLEGEQDCLLGLPFGTGSTEDERELGAPGLPLDAERGLSGIDVLRFGGASREKPGISDGFHGLDLTVGEVPRAGTALFGGAALETEEDRAGAADVVVVLDGVAGLLVGVDDLDADLVAGTDGRDVGVDDLGGPVDGLTREVVGFATEVVLDEVRVGLEVGVEDREGLDVAGSIGRLVGVDGREDLAEAGPPDDDGLRTTELVECKLDEDVGLGNEVTLEAGSGCGFDSCTK